MFAALATSLVVLGWSSLATAASPPASPTQVGYAAQPYPLSVEETGGAATGQKPESKLWYQDGNWWAAMATTSTGSHHIYRLSGTTWVDTGVEIDSRPATKEDVLSLGSKTYFLSRDQVGPSKLRRFSYIGGGYQLDSGFPVDLPVPKVEAMTIARDSTGTLWISYEANKKTFVVRSNGSDTSWGTPFVVPVAPATGLNADDITSVISFRDASGPAIGVFWSNHPSQTDYFAVHRDGAADNAWTVETALSGLNQADDHMDLRTYNGRVYAAVKTSTTSAPDGLIKLLVRSDDGNWANYFVAPYSDRNTRPIVEIDPTSGQLYVFMTIGEGARARGIIYKQSSLTSISFPTTSTIFIQGANLENINNSTSDKNTVSPVSGIVVMASDGVRYWWNRLGGTNTAPSATAQSLIVSGQGATNLSLRGGDAQTCELTFSIVSGPAHGALGPLGAAPCSSGAPNADAVPVSYTPAPGYAGPDSFTYQVTDGTLTSTATITITVNSPPAALPVAVTTTTDTPVTVTLSGSDVETCQLTFAIVSGPATGSLGPIAPDVCIPGANTSSATVVFTPAAGFSGSDSFTFSVSDGTDSTTASVTITVSG